MGALGTGHWAALGTRISVEGERGRGNRPPGVVDDEQRGLAGKQKQEGRGIGWKNKQV
jgi:hypothetical protein